MNDNTKTIAFCGTAIAALALAFFSQPSDLKEFAQSSKKGSLLFDFNAVDASGIQVDEMLVTLDKLTIRKSISVTADDKGWFIRRPDFSYPADAKGKVDRMATSLSNLYIHDLESEKQADHERFGVLDPNDKQTDLSKPLDQILNVGKMITINKQSNSMASLIISRDSLPGQPSLRYARKPKTNEVYSVKFPNFEDASTQFVDWVEKDFLDLDKFDIKRVTLDNYHIDKNAKNLAEAKRQGGQYLLDYESSEWKLSGSSLTDKEELNKDRLDEMRDSFDDLKIIDIKRKPDILISSLRKGNEFASVKSQQEFFEVRNSLGGKGFYVDAKPVGAKGELQLSVVSEKGEILVGMKDGVEYVLRFGDIYRGMEDDVNATGDSRYIYAFARFNQSLLDPPALESVPSPLTEPTPETNASTPSDSNATEGQKGDTGKKGEESKPPSITPPGPPPNFTPPTAPPTAPPTPPAALGNAAPGGSANNPSPLGEFAKKKAERESEIARIQASNATKQREYNEKVQKAQKRVKELNEKLADWYYVISNDVYDKIRLERKDFVKAKESDLPEEISASHILISFTGADRADGDVTRTKEEAKVEAQRIRKLIVDEGKDFAKMASEHSNGPSKSKGGDLGKFKFEVMAKPFSEAAFALEVGAVSEVVETGFGFHVIKRTE